MSNNIQPEELAIARDVPRPKPRMMVAQIIAFTQALGFNLTNWQKKALPGMIPVQKPAVPGSLRAQLIFNAEAKRQRRAERNLKLKAAK